MKNLTSFALAAALFSAGALAQSVFIPNNGYATAAGNGSSANYWRAGLNRFQVIYDSTHFTNQGILAPISITQLSFRLFPLNTTLGTTGITNIVTYPTVNVFLQSSATDYLAGSTTFSNNRTVAIPGQTPNFTGSVTTLPVANTSPNGFFVIIPLTTPFSYDPTAGADLLVEIDLASSPSPLLGNVLECGALATAAALNSYVVRSPGSNTVASGTTTNFVPIIKLDYTPAPNAGVATPQGTGCITKYASIYEYFATPSAFDLAGQAITFTNVGSSYLVSQSGSYLPIGSVQPSPTVLAQGDDTEIIYPFTVGSFSSPYSGAWTGLNICSNGWVSKAPAALPSGNYLFMGAGVAASSLGDPLEAFRSELDLDPVGGTGFGTVEVEESASVTVVNWNGVSNWNNPTGGLGAAPCTFQMQFYPNGDVTIAWVSMTTFSSNNGVFVGFSPDGASLIPGSTDLSALTPTILEPVDINPLALVSVNRPVTNTTWNLRVDNIPQIPVQIGVEIYGFSDPGIADLFFIGAPGCPLRANLDILNPWVNFAPATSHTYSLPVPNAPSLVGVSFFLQSAIMDPSYNTFGAITSNGISGLIGSI